MKVIIADDHRLVREGLAQVLRGCDPITEVLEAEAHDKLWEILDRHHDIALVLLDINMEQVTTVEMLNRIKGDPKKTAIAILSVPENPVLAGKLLNNGAAGYTPKSVSNKLLPSAVMLILSGGVYIPPFVLDTINGSEHDGQSPYPSYRQAAILYGGSCEAPHNDRQQMNF